MGCRSHDRVLEIGCGRGHAVALLCEILTEGKITAMDRSATAIAAAIALNAAAVAAGRAEFRAVTLAEADFARATFDKVLAVNVNLFWTRAPDKELELLRSWLAPGGELFLCWEFPSAQGAGAAERASRSLEAAGFAVRTKMAGRLACLRARPRGA
ncbi:class I SAM-dependent methyltransferase [Pendulispora albinea]|uniref:Class I SAM-dependent methyltransferase n=1 Tax=Pendulispora albinea TaxID=2741071 RepID=A0ABZ2MBA5_9BACT